MGDVRLLVLGPLVVETGERQITLPPGRGRDLLAVLVANANHVVPLDQLGETQAVRTAISRLRRALGGAGFIHTYETGYLAHVTDSDLIDFRTLRDQGRYAEALTLWRGEPFEGIEAVRAPAEKLADERRAAEALVPVPRQLPAPPAQFAGRDRELAELRRSGPVVLLSGVGGAGKTTLALQWANEADFPGGQLHVNLRGFDSSAPARPEDTIRSFLGALGVPPASLPTGVDDQSALYRKLVRGKNMLLMLDNARDADQVRPLLPGDPACRVVITSRNRMDDLADATRLRIDVLDQARAQQVLAQRIGARATAEPQALSRLAARCGGLPLALAIVAARADPQHSLSTLADDFAHEDVLDFLDTGEETTSVRAVFDWSYHRLSVAAQRLFRLLGVHPGPDVSAAAAMSLAGEAPPLTELVTANLITNTGTRFELHDLVRAHARDLVGETEGREALHRLLDHYLHSAYEADTRLYPHRRPLTVPPPVAGVAVERVHGDDACLKWLADEAEVMLALSREAADQGFDRHAWQLTWCVGIHLNRSGRWHEWITTLHRGLAAAQRLGDHPAAARLHHTLAHVHERIGDLTAMSAHLTQSLDLYERHGLTDGQTRIHRALASMNELRGDLIQALHHARRAVDLAGTETELAGALNQVGWLHGLLGQHTTALEHCQKALPLHQAGGDRLGEASTLDSIAYNLHHVGDFTGAITHYRESLRMFASIGEQFEIATTLMNLGDTYLATGQVTEARQVWEEALAIYELLGHSDITKARERLTEWAAGPSSG